MVGAVAGWGCAGGRDGREGNALVAGRVGKRCGCAAGAVVFGEEEARVNNVVTEVEEEANSRFSHSGHLISPSGPCSI